MAKIVEAFIARSFAASDVARIYPLLDFLQTFETLGFVCVSAEAAEAEQVSKKIQDLIQASEIFIGFFTRKYPVILRNRKGLQQLLAGKYDRWTAPSWVLQECGFALALKKKLLLFVEAGVELPTLYGDYEYIEFAAGRYESAFKRTNEMVNRILGKSLAIEIAPAIIETATALPPAPPEEKKKDEPGASDDPGFGLFFEMIFSGLAKRDEDLARKGYEDGLQYFRKHKPDKEIVFTCIYLQERAFAGYTDALSELKSLVSSNPESPYPYSGVAQVLNRFDDPLGAAEYYKMAAEKAELNKDKDWAFYLMRAGECYREAQDFEQSRKYLLKALPVALPTRKLEIFRHLYDLYKSKPLEHEAFGIAELSLLENGAQPDMHFTVAYDYAENTLKELSILHYQILLQQRTEDSGALNNLAINYENFDMHANAVKLYKRAVDLGDTLAAANLGFTYLHAGFLDEARRSVEEASKKPDHDPRVTDCLSAIDKRHVQEDDKYKEISKRANAQREFFREFGSALIQQREVDVRGTWKFPACSMQIKVENQNLTAEGSTTFGSLARLLGGTERKPDRYRIEGVLDHSICKYTLTLDSTEKGLFGTSPKTTYKHGHIVFASDGATGIVFESENDIRKVFKIWRVLPQADVPPLLESRSTT